MPPCTDFTWGRRRCRPCPQLLMRWMSGRAWCRWPSRILSEFVDGTLWGLNQISDADIDAPEGWDIRNSAGNLIVAVVDTGIRYTHQDLAANMWRNPNEIAGNGVDDDGNGLVDDVYGCNAYGRNGNPMDDNGHGSHCSGTIGGVGNNGVGVTGVAWGVKLMACKFLSSTGSGADSDAVTCID
ncbi:MAG: hypothetical protein EBZ78_09680, partial [Verrucomicrobia bacterium]|nr:hypothetical protein [Verrucomicrobiota bacterium]